jgi:hypothetical protein
VTADSVVEESRVDLVVEIFARALFDHQALAFGAVTFEIIVPLLQDKRNPAKLILNEDNF